MSDAALPLRVAMAQINVVAGDIDGNAVKILRWTDRARQADADIVTFPELALMGYPPEDLLLKPQFVDANLNAIGKIVSQTTVAGRALVGLQRRVMRRCPVRPHLTFWSRGARSRSEHLPTSVCK